jgi:NDP-sugar pyrophosphorylase family protein
MTEAVTPREPPLGLVMAGGKGSRMSPAHPFTPKPLVPVAGVPLLEIVLGQLLDAGVKEVCIALRHEAERIRNWVEAHPAGRRATLRCLVEPEPLGTIGALWQLRHERRTIVVMNGDLLSGVDLDALFRSHRERAADLTIATHAEFHRLRLGEVVAGDDHRVSDYVEKPVKEYRISSGIYMLEPSVLRLLEQCEWLAFPQLAKRAIAARLAVFEHLHEDPWFDVNDPADLAVAEQMLRRDPVAFGLSPERVS